MMRCFCIYERPTDFPESFVVREHVAEPGKVTAKPDAHAVVSTLEEARASLPFGLVCIPRFENDDPVIVEVWM